MGQLGCNRACSQQLGGWAWSMASHLSSLTEKETLALESVRICVGDGRRVFQQPPSWSTRVFPTPGSSWGLGRGRVQAPGPAQQAGSGLVVGSPPQGQFSLWGAPGWPFRARSFLRPSRPSHSCPPALVWPGLAAATTPILTIGLRSAESPSPGSRRRAVSACVAWCGAARAGAAFVCSRAWTALSGAGCMELGARGPFPQDTSTLI